MDQNISEKPGIGTARDIAQNVVNALTWDQAELAITEYCDSVVKRATKQIKKEYYDIFWAMLKRERSWRFENSEVGGDEIAESIDRLESELTAAADYVENKPR